jgi:hypothetical protein
MVISQSAAYRRGVPIEAFSIDKNLNSPLARKLFQVQPQRRSILKYPVYGSEPFVHTREKAKAEPIHQNPHKNPIQNLRERKSHCILSQKLQSHKSASGLSQVQKDVLTDNVTENYSNILETFASSDTKSADFCHEAT